MPGDLVHAEPPCPHFGPCGGCQLQHLAYSAQLELKAARLRSLLAAQHPLSFRSAADESASTSLPELQLHPSPPLAYRNRIRLTLAEQAGQLRAGYLTRSEPTPDAEYIASETFREAVSSTEGGALAAAADRPPHLTRAITKASPAFLPITQCPIAAPILWRTTETLLANINQNAAPWLRSPQFKLDQLELFTTADESTLQFTLFLRSVAKSLPANLTAAFNQLCESLRAAIPQLTGASIALLPAASAARSRRTESPRPGPSWGAPGLLYSIPSDAQPTTCWVPRGAFFQINRFLIPGLVALVAAGRRGTLALDLYAGAGLFSRALARSFTRVTAVEIAEPAASALGACKLPNLRAVKATTLDFLRTAVLDRDRPDLVVLDPPRTGAGPEVCALLGRLAAPTLVYVSCSPDKLPADLATLAAAGYSISQLHLVDLFPQTSHIETVAILTR